MQNVAIVDAGILTCQSSGGVQFAPLKTTVLSPLHTTALWMPLPCLLISGVMRLINRILFAWHYISLQRGHGNSTSSASVVQNSGGSGIKGARENQEKKMHKILDVCCGSRAFWFDKQDGRAFFVDKRAGVFPRTHSDTPRAPVVVAPDWQGSFTDLPFPDNTFYHVVFDPPHIVESSASGNVAKYYGVLRGEWREELRRGFAECFRVLRPGGTLIFKWNELAVPVREILALTPEKPLYGHKSGKLSKTHWVAFMKDEDARAENQGSRPNFVQQLLVAIVNFLGDNNMLNLTRYNMDGDIDPAGGWVRYNDIKDKIDNSALSPTNKQSAQLKCSLCGLNGVSDFCVPCVKVMLKESNAL